MGPAEESGHHCVTTESLRRALAPWGGRGLWEGGLAEGSGWGTRSHSLAGKASPGRAIGGSKGNMVTASAAW